jgi:malonate transporter MadL subunit
VVIYGVGLLAGCMLAGLWAGRLLGHALGVEANVGGVGIAMLLLLFFTQLSPKSPVLGPISASGVSFWSAMYIPIVVAMAAKQNVVAAVSSGWVAILAGTLAVLASFALVPVLARWAPKEENDA